MVFLTLLEVIPAEVDSVVLQSIDGTQTELQMSGGENLNPVLLNPTLCANVVLKVSQPDSKHDGTYSTFWIKSSQCIELFYFIKHCSI